MKHRERVHATLAMNDATRSRRTVQDRSRATVASHLLSDASMSSEWLWAAFGGVLIGGASALLLLLHGRIAGISGVVGSLLQRETTDRAWRYAFVAGLLVAGLLVAVAHPASIGATTRSPTLVVIAGLLVGFGTRLGSGCTSGHGVCGLSRFSIRSLVAVATFMTTGALTAMIARVAS
jgi:uncharacterized membrane protein YedE/YeeE